MEQALALATCRACYLPYIDHGSAEEYVYMKKIQVKLKRIG